MKVVFDTNVYISSFMTDGICSGLLKRAARRHFELFICPFILSEIENIMIRKFKVPDEKVKTTLNLILNVSNVLTPTENINGVCRDKDDDNILSCAVSCNADYLITGDKDLLELKSIKRTKIILPKEFELMF